MVATGRPLPPPESAPAPTPCRPPPASCAAQRSLEGRWGVAAPAASAARPCLSDSTSALKPPRHTHLTPPQSADNMCGTRFAHIYLKGTRKQVHPTPITRGTTGHAVLLWYVCQLIHGMQACTFPNSSLSPHLALTHAVLVGVTCGSYLLRNAPPWPRHLRIWSAPQACRQSHPPTYTRVCRRSCNACCMP